MVKFISIAAIVLPAVLSAVQAATTPVGQFVLSSGQLKGTHTIKKITCGKSTSFYETNVALKAGSVYCTYLPNVDMSLCQCHNVDVPASLQNQFSGDVLSHILYLGACTDKSGGVNYANDGTWVNGYYVHADPKQDYMSSATFSKGKVTTDTCKPVGCSYASQGLSWRNFQSVPATC